MKAGIRSTYSNPYIIPNVEDITIKKIRKRFILYEEKGYDRANGRLLVDVDKRLYRPAEVGLLWGDSAKAELELDWKRKVDFHSLVHMMMEADMREIAGIELQHRA